MPLTYAQMYAVKAAKELPFRVTLYVTRLETMLEDAYSAGANKALALLEEKAKNAAELAVNVDESAGAEVAALDEENNA